MEQQVLLRNSVLVVLFLALPWYRVQEQPQATVHTTIGECQAVNGILYLHQQPFTGTLYQLYPGTGDTALLQSYAAGKEHGLWKRFYPDGRLQSSRTFDHGHKTGIYTTWWKSGLLQQQYHFEEDEYEGACYEWNEQGVLIKEMHYHQGHEEGSQQLFYNNGKIRANYTIINGRRYGLLGTKNCINVSEKVPKP
jgi:antitoxin component YwqK of YwqJK toxin-antitoxin module